MISASCSNLTGLF